MEPFGRALVVRIGALGDTILTRRLTYSLFLAGLRSTLFAPARHASLLKGDPWIEEVMDSESPFFAEAFTGSWPGSPDVYDLAVVLSESEGLAQATRSIAKSTIRIPGHSTSDDTPISRQWANAIGPLCEPFVGILPLLKPPTGPGGRTGATLLHPGSGSRAKNWPVDCFIDLGRTLERAGHRIGWIRGPAEEMASADTAGFDVMDRLSLPDLARALAAARLLVGNDSGVSHLAAALGTPTVAIFGPTNARVWRPEGPRVAINRAPSGALAEVRQTDVLASISRLTGIG